METYGKIDSKFRFVILASKRAKQLLKGAKPKIRSKSKSLIRLAQLEVKEGLINYEILHPQKEEIVEPEGRAFSGDELGGGAEESEEDILKDPELDEKEEAEEKDFEEELEEVETENKEED